MKSIYTDKIVALLLCVSVTAGAQTHPDDGHCDAAFGAAAANDRVRVLVFDSNDLYAGGNFLEIGGIAAYRIARWDGQVWHALGPGPGIVEGENDCVSGILVYDGIVYAGGDISPSGGTQWNHVARWNGYQWLQMGSGLENLLFVPTVTDIVEFQGDVYVSGGFSIAGSKTVNGIARWDGTQWHDLDGGLQLDGYTPSATAMVCDENYLYVIGNFHWGDIKNIARWDGIQWSALTDFRTGEYRDMALVGTDLYIAGNYNTNGQDGTVNNIGRWDGIQWHCMGGGTNNRVMSVFPVGEYVYIAGNFTSAGGNPINRVAVWDGADWRGLGSGVDLRTWTLAVAARDNGEVFVGGDHDTAGGIPSPRIARWFNPVPYPTAPLPPNGAVIKPSGVVLDWGTSGTSGSPDTWDVYLGTSPDPPLVASGLTTSGFTPEIVYNDTQYYWKVVGRDGLGHQATSSVWTFRTEVSWLVVSTDTVFCGTGPDTVRIDINLEDCDLPIDAAGVDVLYDPSVLTYLYCERGDLTQDWQYFECSDQGTSVRVGGFDTTAIPRGSYGVLAGLYFLADCCGADSTVSYDLVPVNLTDDVAQLHGVSGTYTCVYYDGTSADDTTPRYPRYALHQNYPNPFNPNTEIRYEIPDQAGRTRVKISIYDVQGRLVKQLENIERSAGEYTARWNGLNESGESVSSGVYFYVLRTGQVTLSRKLVLLK